MRYHDNGGGVFRKTKVLEKNTFGLCLKCTSSYRSNLPECVLFYNTVSLIN